MVCPVTDKQYNYYNLLIPQYVATSFLTVHEIADRTVSLIL